MLKSVSVKSAVRDALEIFQFDQWLRFYFVKEKDGGLWMSVSEDALADIRDNHPRMVTLVEMLNESAIDYRTSQDTVCSFVGAELDGAKYDPAIMPKVFDHSDFKIEMYMFNLWTKMHEAYLDEEFKSFSEWKEWFGEWSDMAEIREYREKLVKSGQDPNIPSCSTPQ
ncbi:hypothetical protein [Pseudodesulfovibrio tunisiensis]|uniref:hypothetical protein n=1 Tax=Pseudodesulfovibrio tunisiensis TaxID=463192 RepID=UPI001FB1E2FB|nr:hypothetical protein [Pseudodesulfovibrio tunisiensis]